MGEIAGAGRGSDMQASLLDIGWVSRVARIGCLKQLPVVVTASSNHARNLPSDGNQRIISRTPCARGLPGAIGQCSPSSSDDQNEPLASLRGDVIVLERNIVNRTCRAARLGSKPLSPGRARCNRALEQSLVQCSWVRRGADARAMKVPRVTPRVGTNGEENGSVKRYARLHSTRAKDSRATFTECYAVPAMIRDGTPGKGDGS